MVDELDYENAVQTIWDYDRAVSFALSTLPLKVNGNSLSAAQIQKMREQVKEIIDETYSEVTKQALADKEAYERQDRTSYDREHTAYYIPRIAC